VTFCKLVKPGWLRKKSGSGTGMLFMDSAIKIKQVQASISMPAPVKKRMGYILKKVSVLLFF
jgi:hypothetical protein